MCDQCMTFWIEHGRRNRKEDKPSEEEKALNRREEEHNKKAVSNSKGQKGRKKAAVASESQSTTRNGPRKRVSQRIKEDSLSKKDHRTYKVDNTGAAMTINQHGIISLQRIITVRGREQRVKAMTRT